MIIELDFCDFSQFIKVSSKVGRKINKISENFLHESTESFVLSEMNEEELELFRKSLEDDNGWDGKDFVKWLNRKYKRANAKLIKNNNSQEAKKIIYF